MKPGFLFLLALSCCLLSAVPANAQTSSAAPANPIDESRRVVLHGTVHALAQPQYDRGAVPDFFPAARMLVMLKRRPEREASLQKFLRDVHVPGSPSYHKWTTPEEFGARFGAADEDIGTVTGWLRGHGFSVARVSKNRTLVEFSGTAAQVREALQTEIHQYAVNGETRYSIATEASIPAALAQAIRGFAPLNDFEMTSYVHTVGSATYSPTTHRATPLFTTQLNGQNFYALAPEDFATQYNLGPVYQAGLDGTGQTIGIIGGSNIDLSLVNAHRSLFGLPPSNVQVVIDGEDPGPQLAPNIEGFLDVEVSGAVARKATINFYIAGGTHFQGLIALAALRAVEDNQASILSASFGECEPLLGESGNQFWNSLWEQAAAQGQSVFVASGDTGPATCPLAGILANGTVETFGLTVNGLSSTPWNISVGGTDFFYSDFAAGAPSAATLWNATNDSSFGSLKAPLPEQPWDNQLGLNAIPPFQGSFSVPSAAGGGGPSNCAQSTGTPPTCVAGYPKPSWQNAPGVPNDGVRDLPDVSLFAASGKNLSAYPICAHAGDCAAVATGEPQVLLVGGTSASTPAMAGILALVNQKTGGRQGQANFTLYALARQKPSVFRDITMGTNDVLCIPGSKDCNTPIPNGPPSNFIESYGVYPAGPGYDLASGIGSFDANALINNWASITFLPTTTSLQLSPSTIVHGAPVNVTTATLPLLQSGALPLTGGSANANISFFPGGTYQVTAQYAGDGVFGTSSSSPVTLTVTPEASAMNFDLRFLYDDFNTTPITGHSGTVQNGMEVPFSSEWTFEAQPFGINSQTKGLATGTMTFTDGSTSIQVSLNSTGTAVWSPQVLALGSHSVMASYSGDASYNPSTASPLNFTVSKGIPRFIVTADAAEFVAGPGQSPSFLAGSTLVVHVLLSALNSLVPPTGNVTVNLGSQSQTLALTQNAFINQGLSTGFVTFPNIAAGSYTFSASYTGDTNWNSATFTDPNPLVFTTLNAIATTTTLTVSPASVTSSSAATFTVTVQAPQGSPGPQISLVSLYANGTIFADVLLQPPTAANPSTSTGVLVVPGSGLPAGSLQVLANFQGFGNYEPSKSATVPLTVMQTNFAMSLGASNMTIKSGQSGTVPILLGGPNGGSVTLSLACQPSSSQIACSVNPSSPSVNGSMTATLMVNAFVPSTATADLHTSRGLHAGYFVAGTTFASAFGLLFVLPHRKRRTRTLLGLALAASVCFLASCGAGGSSSTTPPPPSNINATAGTYTVLVTGTSSGVTHNAKLTILVQ